MDVDLWSSETTTETLPDAPTVLDASDITSVSFTANWYFNENTTGYYLDVATDSAFTAMVAGYNNLNVGNVNSYSVIGLMAGSDYYYRIRAYNDAGISANSDSVYSKTTTIYNDFFLGSKDEVNAQYTELHLYGMGDYSNAMSYWSSSETGASSCWAQNFNNGFQNNNFKNSLYLSRPIRKFTSTTIYSLRDIGPAGGLIFIVVDNGGGSYTYYETATSDQPANLWSNITGTLIGVTAHGTAVGTGITNTAAIIGQAGHISSAAKLCSDLIIYG